jgi:hypothetical protein
MKRIILISCVSKKLNIKSRAEELYDSPLFNKNLEYAKSLKPDDIFILSAKYGLLDLDEKIQPYDLTLNQMKKSEIQLWAQGVVGQLKLKSDFINDEFIFLAGQKYREFILPHITHYRIPMEGLKIGQQLKWLTERIP